MYITIFLQVDKHAFNFSKHTDRITLTSFIKFSLELSSVKFIVK